MYLFYLQGMQDIAKDKASGLTPHKDDKNEPLRYLHYCIESSLVCFFFFLVTSVQLFQMQMCIHARVKTSLICGKQHDDKTLCGNTFTHNCPSTLAYTLRSEVVHQAIYRRTQDNYSINNALWYKKI